MNDTPPPVTPPTQPTPPPATTATAAVSASATYSTASQPIPLSATVTSSFGIVDEGTETFTILSGSTTIGTPITVNVSAGAAAGTYTIQMEATDGRGNTLPTGTWKVTISSSPAANFTVAGGGAGTS